MHAYRYIGALCAAGLAGMPQAAWAQCHYNVTIIQGDECGIFGPDPVIGQGLNADGAMAGWFQECIFTDRACKWTPENGLQQLQFPVPTLRSRAYDISGDMIVGEFDLPGDQLGVIGFLFDGDAFLPLPVPTGAGTVTALETNGQQITGYWVNTTGPKHAFFYENGEMIDIQGDLNPAMQNSQGRAINKHGQIAGWSWPGLLELNDGRAFLWDNGRAIELPPVPGGISSIGWGMNDRGDVVGRGAVADPDTGALVARGFIWMDGEMIGVDPFPSFLASHVHDINNVRQAVGWSTQPGTDGFIWQHGVQTRLMDLVPPDIFWSLSDMREIDDDGRIVGTGSVLGGITVGVILTPYDQPDGDIDNDCDVGPYDLAILLDEWGKSDSFADVNGDGAVDPRDLAVLLGNWGR